MKKALMCQIDSSFTGKNSKCYGNASLTKQGNMLSVVSLDNRISVLDLTTFDYLPPKEIIDPSLQCSFFTKSQFIGKEYLAIGPKDSASIQVWDINANKVVARIGGSTNNESELRYGHMLDINDMAFNRDTHQLLSCSDDSSVLVWDLI